MFILKSNLHVLDCFYKFTNEKIIDLEQTFKQDYNKFPRLAVSQTSSASWRICRTLAD
jgi:hypothetical protein